jgi:hypothetical protein
METAMAYNSRIEIIASKAIAYMRLRLATERLLSMDAPFKGFEDIDEIIGHMCSRLKPAFENPIDDILRLSRKGIRDYA